MSYIVRIGLVQPITGSIMGQDSSDNAVGQDSSSHGQYSSSEECDDSSKVGQESLDL